MEQLKQRLTPAKICLLLVCFLAPILGGHVPAAVLPITDGFFGELLGGGALPLTTRLLLTFFISLGLYFALNKQKVVQIPNIKFFGLLSLFIILLGTSAITSNFQYHAIREFTVWVVYVGIFLLTIASLGRGHESKLAIIAIGAGCAVVGLKGIGEFLSIMKEEPAHRIFADWNNPNGVASIFLVGTVLMSGFFASENSKLKWIGFASALLSACGIFLTQSKGGLLALVVGFVCLLILAISTRFDKKYLLAPLPAIFGIALALGLGQLANQAAASDVAFNRLGSAGAQAEQSVGFRQNLWKSAIQLANDNQLGTGIGTYQFNSAKPGLTEQTVYAHQSFLQIASEAGWMSLLLLFLIIGFWFVLVFKASKTQPTEKRMLKISVMATILAIGAHGFVESNLSFFGIGIVTFALLGIGFQLSTDASAPEYLPNTFRSAFSLFVGLLPLIGLAIFSAAEIKKASLVTTLMTEDFAAFEQQKKGFGDSTYGDPEITYLGGLYDDHSDEDRARIIAGAAKKMPTTRILRGLADAEIKNEDYSAARSALIKALEYDPNNLKSLKKLMDLAELQGDTESAIEYAHKLITVEDSVSYQVRAIPELVPTETLEARDYLAGKTESTEEKTQFYIEALRGYVRYAELTYPRVKLMSTNGLDYGGQTMEIAEENMLKAKRLGEEILRLSSDEEINEETTKLLKTIEEVTAE